MNKVKPITPDEVVPLKESLIPDEVFEAFNELIAENFSGGSATIRQSDIVARATDKIKAKGGLIFDYKWLDIEDIYRKAGWKVSYDKPGYNESYPAIFEFSRKRD